MKKAKNPPMPKDPENLKIWLERLRAQVEAAKYDTDMKRILVEAEKIETDRLAALAERHKIASIEEKNRLEMERLRMELDALKHERKLKDALASNALVYSFYSRVDSDKVSDAMKTMDEWSRVHPGKDIEVQLTSAGGSVLDGLALYDFLRILSARGHKVGVTAYGMCASIGSILLQAGDERKLGENSYVMLHEISFGAWGTPTAVSEDLDFAKILEGRLVDILCARSKLTPKTLAKMWHKKDIWLDSGKSLKLGLIDSIVK